MSIEMTTVEAPKQLDICCFCLDPMTDNCRSWLHVNMCRVCHEGVWDRDYCRQMARRRARAERKAAKVR